MQVINVGVAFSQRCLLGLSIYTQVVVTSRLSIQWPGSRADSLPGLTFITESLAAVSSKPGGSDESCVRYLPD